MSVKSEVDIYKSVIECERGIFYSLEREALMARDYISVIDIVRIL